MEATNKKENHIIDIIDLYLHKLQQLIGFDDTKSFPVYVFEKPDVNILETENITKDGIHMIIGSVYQNHMKS